MKRPYLSASLTAISALSGAAAQQPSSLAVTWFSGVAPITVDGNLSDWDATGGMPAIMLNDCPMLADPFPKSGFQANFRALADGTFLYIAVTLNQALASGKWREGTKLVDIQLYGGTSLEALRYKRFRGLDGLFTVSQGSEPETAVLGGSIRLPGEFEPAMVIDVPNTWTLLGAKAAVMRRENGYSVEIAIPLWAIRPVIADVAGTGLQGRLQLNVRAFNSQPDGSTAALQWVPDPGNTSETSHEMLGEITLTPTIGAIPRDAAKDPVAENIRSALLQIGSGHASDAIGLLGSGSGAQLIPLLAFALERAGQPESARSLRSVLASASTEPSTARWAAKLTGRGDSRSPLTDAEGLVDSDRWSEAILALQAIADNPATSVSDRTRAHLGVQKAQWHGGKTEESISTALRMQERAPDSDPARRESFEHLVTSWYSPEQSLERIRLAAAQRHAPPPLSSRFVEALGRRSTDVGCRQTLEFAELLRSEGSLQAAIQKYRAASAMPGCAREDRAWALLLLERSELNTGDIAGALGAMTILRDEFSEEWEIRFASLADLDGFTMGEDAEARRRAVIAFNEEMRAAASGDLNESRRAVLLGERLSTSRQATAQPDQSGQQAREGK